MRDMMEVMIGNTNGIFPGRLLQYDIAWEGNAIWAF